MLRISSYHSVQVSFSFRSLYVSFFRDRPFCGDPLCSDTSEVPPTCSVLAPPFVSHFEVGPSHAPLSTDYDQSDPEVASPVVSDPRPSDSSSFCQETSLLPITRDHDEDVTLLKSHFDRGGSEIPAQVRESSVEGTIRHRQLMAFQNTSLSSFLIRFNRMIFQ